ncbi:neuroguidin-like [Elysia marginata]|uniref:Neuroguidin-like n=1 Tax=Elysia marginata TaxID=1093978 RepID=A0AAV4JHZ1_9GAST|nr:neuroguidin-like [Elysia marginata]
MADAEVEIEIPEALSLFKEIKKSSGECLQHVRALTAKIQESPKLPHGMSFLDVKNQLMGSYMANLALLMDKKTSGQSVKNHHSIDRLVEIRTVLEKMRPIEHKLKYQINKVVTAYKDKKQDPSDPRKFKANFGAFANASESDSSEDEDTKEKDDDKPKTYVAPKLAPESRDMHRIRDNRKVKERTEYEENNFMRLPVSKKESAGMKKMGTMSALGALADFEDMGDMGGSAKNGPANKKRKIAQKVSLSCMVHED